MLSLPRHTDAGGDGCLGGLFVVDAKEVTLGVET
jgi:hypothetical protein